MMFPAWTVLTSKAVHAASIGEVNDERRRIPVGLLDVCCLSGETRLSHEADKPAVAAVTLLKCAGEAGVRLTEPQGETGQAASGQAGGA